MKLKIPPILFLFLICLAVPSSGSYAADWSQRWQQSSTEIWNGQEVGFFDQMGIWATEGTGMVFGDPAFSDFSASGWTVYNETGDTGARAFSSAPFTYIQFDMNYATQFGVADFLYMCAYQGELRQRQHITYSPVTGWDYPAFTGTDAEWHAMGGGDPVPVPEPSMLAIFGSFLTLLPYITRR